MLSLIGQINVTGNHEKIIQHIQKVEARPCRQLLEVHRAPCYASGTQRVNCAVS